MKNKWLSFFTGKIQLQVMGTGIERFLNECIRRGIPLFDVKRKDQIVFLYILLSDVHVFRKTIRDFDCKCRFLKRKGLPFLLQKSKRNSGFTLGIAAFFVIMFLLSNMIWKIDISGANPETEHQIRQELNRIGIKKGRLQFLIMTPQKIQQSLTKKVENITWVGIELNGTALHMKVVEKNEPEKEKGISPRHIIAKKDATISSMFVEKGEPLVTVNEHVKKGQKLVSGLIGNEEDEEEDKQKVGAKGEIFGETWYRSTVTVPLETSFDVFTGKVKTRHKLSSGFLSVPFWGFSFKEEKLSDPKTETEEHPLHFFKFTLPFTYVKETTRESEKVKRVYTKKEAAREAIKMGKQDVRKKIGDDGKIISEKVLHETSENGKVKLIILYQVIEDIVQTTPIVQETKE
ncbi:sporulation protein YqfD [Bacillus sp. CLL-7-23]|uniref:Sporulation protein YqfD n=1 Tax=Bacillus changyiensis TaxID=3004103 RepID=A0ABT4X3L9_9BACI|nr:sporulation protein YqfD [Bacillus changyiensis]MDA7026897.1 sporulation protein YqfD [Bacillus changyiensis]